MRQKRYPLLLDTTYPPEEQLLAAINAVPDGERAGFLRALAMVGHQEIEKEQRRPPPKEGGTSDAGTH